MAGIQFLEPHPTSIIIDDFSSIIDSAGPRTDDSKHLDQYIITLAYINDAMDFIQESNPNNHSLYLIITDSFLSSHHRSIISKTLSTSLELHRPAASNTSTITLQNNSILSQQPQQHQHQQQPIAFVKHQQGKLIASKS